MIDIVELLRERHSFLCDEAADEIERLRGALQRIADQHSDKYCGDPEKEDDQMARNDLAEIASEALAGATVQPSATLDKVWFDGKGRVRTTVTHRSEQTAEFDVPTDPTPAPQPSAAPRWLKLHNAENGHWDTDAGNCAPGCPACAADPTDAAPEWPAGYFRHTDECARCGSYKGCHGANGECPDDDGRLPADDPSLAASYKAGERKPVATALLNITDALSAGARVTMHGGGSGGGSGGGKSSGNSKV